MAKLSWIEQKAAAALFAAPPTATFDEALGHFEQAEQMDPGFYPKNLLLLAQACAKLGRKPEAEAWRAKCLAATARTPEDEQTPEGTQTLLPSVKPVSTREKLKAKMKGGARRRGRPRAIE